MKYECVVGKLSHISSITDKFFAKRIREERIPILMNHIPLFYILAASSEPVVFNELRKEWGISKSSLSELINKYQKMGFVEKNASSDDKRSVFVSLTTEGTKIKDEIRNIEMELMKLFFKDFNIQEQEVFEKNIDHIIKNSSTI